MSTTKNLFSRKNLDFLLFEVLNIGDLKRFNYFKNHDAESFAFVLDTATEIAEREMQPYFVESDRQQPELVNGVVKVHFGIHAYVKAFSEAGLLGAAFPEELGGIQLPKTITAAIDFILCCSSNSFIMYTDLTKGIASLITTFGTETQKATFLPNILSGKWLGTMCLTETESGSSLANITTTAYPSADGSYGIKGQKIFISAGDHDITENIIHLVLARIDGAPKGTKGISLFIVPKKKEDGTHNDVSSIGIYHKMGQKATPAMHLEFGAQDGCTGFLLGEANRGLAHMFLMMDSARLSVGAMGAGIASAAYYNALQYAKERKQGIRLNAEKTVSDSTTIIHHPDVRRMLFLQKAYIEGALCFVLQCSKYLDIQKNTTDEEEKKRCTRLLNLLTPVVKTVGAEKGVDSVNQALQVLGGYGYTEDFPLEQLARDVRILPIYEGTSGIHSLGLLGRQVLADGGRSLALWEEEVRADIKIAEGLGNLKKYAQKLLTEIAILEKITLHIKGLTKENSPEVYLANASLYMDFFGTLNLAWQWFKQGIAAQMCLENTEKGDAFYESKLHTMHYFFDYEMPKLKGLAESLLNAGSLTIFDEQGEFLL